MARRALLLLLVAAVTGCGGSPFESIGERSSGWINEPTVPTTVAVEVTTPTVVPTSRLQWANDEIDTENLSDQDALLGEIFSRREGDRFIQSSRAEIAVAMPGVAFPEEAPLGAQWVSSQLVFDNDGSLANDPTAAFGVWSAVPYSRSRSVAQMVVLRVSIAPDAAAEVASSGEDLSCARFSDRNTDQCEIVDIADRPTWWLRDTEGATLIWFDDPYQYEMFGRSFVPEDVLRGMSAAMVPLGSFDGEPS